MTAADALDVDLAPLVASFWSGLLPVTMARRVVALSLWALTDRGRSLTHSGPQSPVSVRRSASTRGVGLLTWAEREGSYVTDERRAS